MDATITAGMKLQVQIGSTGLQMHRGRTLDVVEVTRAGEGARVMVRDSFGRTLAFRAATWTALAREQFHLHHDTGHEIVVMPL